MTISIIIVARKNRDKTALKSFWKDKQITKNSILNQLSKDLVTKLDIKL